jgi:signal transduction histidine kinase
MGALVLLALVPTLVLVVSLVLAEHMTGDARRIDVAGSLRTSGFAVAAQLNSYIASPAAYKRDIVEDELVRMNATLLGLENGSQALQIDALRDRTSRERLAEARHALGLYREVTDRVFAQVEAGFPSAEAREALSQEVLGSAYGLFALTNRLSQSLEAESSGALQRLGLLQGIAVAVALAVTVLTIVAVDRFVLKPIPNLMQAFSEVQAGRYGGQVAVRGENEFSGLASGFNRMSSGLEAAHHALVLKQGEILEKNAQLERASKLKSQFVANMSHELRTPLNGIIGYTKLLRSGVYGPVPEKLHEPLQGIDETSSALLVLINDILDVAKIEAGKMDLNLEPLRMEDVVRQVGEMLQPLAIAKQLEFVVDDSAETPAVTTDRDKVRRILLNLGGNAIKFTRRGRVEIVLQCGAEPGIVEVVVRDTGIGIAAADLDAIFEDFRQLDGSATREQGGTGLGLAISRRLARHLGGEIAVESRLGVGSTFTLRLPVFVHIDGGPHDAAATRAARSTGPAVGSGRSSHGNAEGPA